MDVVKQIREWRGEAAIMKVEASELDAKANGAIMRRVKTMGGIPDLDSLCLNCGALVRHGEPHSCKRETP